MLVQRRIEFRTWDDLLTELDRLEASDRAGRIERAGTWSPGQNAWHVSEFIRMSIDGFGFRAPLPLRLAASLIKGWAMGPKPIPRNIALRGPMARVIPHEPISTAAGFAALRAQIDRIERGGEQCTHPSPLFGALTHDEWVRLHLKHAAHHLGMLHPSGAPKRA